MFRGRRDLLELLEAANRVRLELYECSEVNLLWSGNNILPCSRLFAVTESNGRSYVEQIGGKRLYLRSGCIYFLGAAEEYGFHFEYGTRFYAFHFDTLTPAGDDFFFKSGLFIEEPECEAWIGMIDRIFAAPGEADNALRLKGMLLQKILNYLPQREKSSEKPLVCERELYTFLRNHANAQTTIADLAQIVGLSPDTFSRHFSRRNRIPVKQYLDHSIAARASRLLRDPALKIKDVAERLNFRSEYYFSRFYKRETSQTPSEFRTGIAPE
ncbi:MAG: helix-turn-helix transcriptional regulator [Lentisphaeria bacterium]|nr:helix-turn-helix transcriptional regulator [Lentisphaeria bacterium]